MDARVKPGHDAEFVAAFVATLESTNPFLPRPCFAQWRRAKLTPSPVVSPRHEIHIDQKRGWPWRSDRQCEDRTMAKATTAAARQRTRQLVGRAGPAAARHGQARRQIGL